MEDSHKYSMAVSKIKFFILGGGKKKKDKNAEAIVR